MSGFNTQTFPSGAARHKPRTPPATAGSFNPSRVRRHGRWYNPTQAMKTDGNSPEAIRQLRERQEQVRKDIERELEAAKQKDGPARMKPQS